MYLEKEKTLHFVSLGCPKNRVDSEIMLGDLLKQGYRVTDEPQNAHTIVVNTCGFIDEAKKESISQILEANDLRSKGVLRKLVVTGCLVQRYKSELMEEFPEVDIFVGSGDFQNISKILKNPGEKKDYFYNRTYLQEDQTHRLNTEPFYRSYLKISEGCLKRCSFCAIPKIRGSLQSRKLKSILSEARLLVASKVCEINVVSHDFTDYGWDLRRKDKEAVESPYVLLDRLSQVKGLDWIRLLYLYPDGITSNIIDLIKERSNLIPYFDMPLQHISDPMLKAMNRRTSGDHIRALLDQIRSKMPEAVFRSQFIVGYPGETESMFKELLRFIEDQELDRVGCFKYSPQEGTAGFKMEPKVDEETKERRYHELMALQMEVSRKKQRAFLGQRVEVRVDGVSSSTDLLLEGRMATQAPEIDGVVFINGGQAQVGEKVWVEITDSHDYDLVGHIVDFGV